MKLVSIKSDDVTSDLFLYAVEQYKLHNKDVQVDINIIKEEYQRFWFILKLFSIYKNSGELNTRLLLNHFIILTNIFEIAAVHILLEIAIDKEDYDIISYTLTLLNFVGYISTDKHFFIRNQEYLYQNVAFDMGILNKLEAILNEQT